MSSLNDFCQENEVGASMVYSLGYSRQMDVLRQLEYITLIKWDVVSSHTSKSIKLPVCQCSMMGVTVTVRGNFHNWIVSCRSASPIKTEMIETAVHPKLRDREIHRVYCEGFPESCIHGPMASNTGMFTVELNYTLEFPIFMHLLRLTLLGRLPHEDN